MKNSPFPLHIPSGCSLIILNEEPLHILDWLAIGIYIVLLFGLGFYRNKKERDSSSDYILAGRKLSLPGFVATLVATWYGGILGVGENTYLYGIQTWFIFSFPYYVFAILFALFLAPKIRNKEFSSIPDHFRDHYGPSVGIVSGVLIMILVSPAPYILSLGILLNHTLGWELQPAILISAGFSLMYIWNGGFRSVIRTDILQFGLMFFGFIALLAFVWGLSDGPLTLVSTLPKKFFDPLGGHSIQYILVWFFIALWTFVDPGFYQRTAAASSPIIAKKGILLSVCFWFVFDILTVTTGLYAAALFPNLDAVMSYPELASRILPPFIYGIFLTGLFSTIMSTIDSNGFLSAITFGRDILLRINQKDISEEKTHIQKGLVVMAFLAVLLAISIPSIVKLWYVLGSIIVPGILFPFLLTFTSIRLNESKGVLTLIIPVIVAIGWFYIGKLNGQYLFNLEPFYPGILTSAALIGIWKNEI